MASIMTESEKLLKLYELTVNEHHFYLEAHQKRIDFYSGFVSVLLTATVVGLSQASSWYHYAFLCIVPLLIFAICSVAIQGTLRVYQRVLECIGVRAKIEQMLGLTRTSPGINDRSDAYWGSEPIVPHRHIESRKEYESSHAFIKAYLTRGLQLWATRLFRIFQWLSLGLFVGLLALSIWKFAAP